MEPWKFPHQLVMKRSISLFEARKVGGSSVAFLIGRGEAGGSSSSSPSSKNFPAQKKASRFFLFVSEWVGEG